MFFFRLQFFAAITCKTDSHDEWSPNESLQRNDCTGLEAFASWTLRSSLRTIALKPPIMLVRNMGKRQKEVRMVSHGNTGGMHLTEKKMGSE
jgi:hypothetical protein